MVGHTRLDEMASDNDRFVKCHAVSIRKVAIPGEDIGHGIRRDVVFLHERSYLAYRRKQKNSEGWVQLAPRAQCSAPVMLHLLALHH